MIRRRVLAVLAALAALLPLSAGDIARFANLGFSPDSSTFMFGQYGVEASTSRPWAELSWVDTARNAFLPKGQIRRVFASPLEAGHSADAGLFILLEEAAARTATLKIDHLASGRLLYAFVDGEEVAQQLTFRDFKAGNSWEIAIEKTVRGEKDQVSSSFGLSILRAAPDGKQQRAKAGNPAIVRQGVKDYLIRNVILAPDERTLVLVIEKVIVDKGDQSHRYMVETLRLPAR